MIRTLKGKLKAASGLLRRSHPQIEPADALNRRYEGGQLKAFSKAYFSERNILISDLLRTTYHQFQQGAETDKLSTLLIDSRFGGFDERIVEYTWILRRMLEIDPTSKPLLLDVGCVLNHVHLVDYLPTIFDMVWFMNPSPEKLHFDQNSAYVYSDIRDNRLPPGLRFDVVSCLSTLEHIGMDTMRYGGPGGEVNIDPKNPERNAIVALRSLCSLLKSTGVAYLSVPFGEFEYLYDFGKNTPIYYVFDKRRIVSLISAIEGQVDRIHLEYYKVVPGSGWYQTTLDDTDILKYADGCAGAGAVALIELFKK